MALYTDIPTTSDLETLISVRRRGCVAIYLPTSPITTEAADADRIELKNLAKEAVLGSPGPQPRGLRQPRLDPALSPAEPARADG